MVRVLQWLLSNLLMEESVEPLFCSWCLLLCASLCFPVIQTEPAQAIFCCFNGWPALCDARCLEERWWEGEEEICSFSRYPLLNRLSCTTTTHLGLVSQRCSRIFKSGKGSPGVKKQNQFCFQCKILVVYKWDMMSHIEWYKEDRGNAEYSPFWLLLPFWGGLRVVIESCCGKASPSNTGGTN